MKHTLTIIVMLLAAFSAQAAITASQVLSKSAQKLRSMPSLTADLSISGQQGSTSAKILLSGEKFALTSSGAQSVWYDGKTQWVYNPQVDEINISTPSAEELTQINPFKIISSFQKWYTARLLNSDASTYEIELTPTDKHSDFNKLVITFSSATYLPVKVVLDTRSMGTATVKITNIKEGAKVAASKFSPSAKDYPTTEFVDLR